jgi:hypothetical protein
VHRINHKNFLRGGSRLKPQAELFRELTDMLCVNKVLFILVIASSLLLPVGTQDNRLKFEVAPVKPVQGGLVIKQLSD